MITVLLNIAYYIISANWGAWWFRIRGGAYDEYEHIVPYRLLGSTAIRIYYALAISSVIWVIHSLVWWSLPLLVGLLWLGVVFGWGEWMTIGVNTGKPWRDLGMMSLRGLLVTGPAGLLLWLLGAPIGITFGLCGLGMGLCYALGWHVAWPWWDKDPLARAEIIFGAWIGLFMLNGL